MASRAGRPCSSRAERGRCRRQAELAGGRYGGSDGAPELRWLHPRPSLYLVQRHVLLLVVLDDLGRPELRLRRVLAGVAPALPLVEQVVDLVELDLDLLGASSRPACRDRVPSPALAQSASSSRERALIRSKRSSSPGIAFLYLVRGKPRSILEVPGSGQREVTILARV